MSPHTKEDVKGENFYFQDNQWAWEKSWDDEQEKWEKEQSKLQEEQEARHRQHQDNPPNYSFLHSRGGYGRERLSKTRNDDAVARNEGAIRAAKQRAKKGGTVDLPTALEERRRGIRNDADGEWV